MANPSGKMFATGVGKSARPGKGGCGRGNMFRSVGKPLFSAAKQAFFASGCRSLAKRQEIDSFFPLPLAAGRGMGNLLWVCKQR